MSVSEAERIYRRRLLASAMPDGVTPETLQKSITVLEQEFGDVAPLKYSALVARLQDNLDRAELNVGQLLGQIMKLRKASPNDLGPDPGADVATSSSNGGATTTRLEGRLKVFNSLFGFIAADARRRGASASLQEHFQSKADSIGVPQPCLGTVKAWASTGGAPAIEGTNEDLQKVINSAFVWLCNNVGPVDADKILLTAVKATETLPESFDCSPRTFL